MRFAYADPPYIGMAKRYYSHDPQCAEVDHYLLIHTLYTCFPDGWALSCSSPTLSEILSICDAEVTNLTADGKVAAMPRIAVWCKSFCAFKKGVRPCYAWEPILFHGGRNPSNGHKHPPPLKDGKQTTPKDFIVEPITLQKGLVGAKPYNVCKWILELLNFQNGDELVDLYPGTGVMGRAASHFGKQLELV